MSNWRPQKPKRGGNQQLAEVNERAKPLGIDVTTRSCHGKPSVEIINYADDIDAGLVVLGYHGHSHDITDNIGSVTDRVVQNAARAVLIVA